MIRGTEKLFIITLVCIGQIFSDKIIFRHLKKRRYSFDLVFAEGGIIFAALMR